MDSKKNNRSFWNRYAGLYDLEIRKFNGQAYAEMYRLISRALTKEMRVLEIATGTGLIAINVAPFAKSVEAVDFAPKMIDAARKKQAPPNVRFSVADATALPFEPHSFDAVIISNALHIMPNPELVLENIWRALRPGGLLIAPTYSHGHLQESAWSLNTRILKLIGFETYSKWLPEEYVAYIGGHGFSVKSWRVLQAAFPLVYLEARADEKPVESQI